MFWSWNGAPSSCPAIFRRAAPPVSARRFFCSEPRPTALIPQIESGWCRGCPRRSRLAGQFVLFPVLVGSRRSAAPWPLQRHARIQERVKPSGRVQGHRTPRVGKIVGNGRRGGSGSIERIAHPRPPRRTRARRRLPRPAGRGLRVLPSFARLSWRRPSGRDAPRRGRAGHRCRRGCALRRDHRRPHDPAARRRHGSRDGSGGTRADRRRRHDGFGGGHAGAQAGAVHGRLSRSGRFLFRERGTTREAKAGLVNKPCIMKQLHAIGGDHLRNGRPWPRCARRRA